MTSHVDFQDTAGYSAAGWEAEPVRDLEPQAGGDQEQPVVAVESYAESIARAQLIEAQAEAVRLKGEAEAEAVRLKAANEMAVARGKAEAQRKREEVAAAKQAAKADAEIAEINAKAEQARAVLEEERRERRAAAEERQRRAELARAEEENKARTRASWKWAAITFAGVCALVSLPVQLDAFWNPHAPWLVVAPVVLEGGAWVVLRGAAAAVAEHRPHWHYRLIAWSLAFIASGINLSHGLTHFDKATAIGTAFASLAGPGVWDLHEHGRIRLRDGVLTRRQRKDAAAAAAAEALAAQELAAAEQELLAAELAAKEEAEAECRKLAEALAARRQEDYPQEWQRALKVAAALGQVEVTDAVWRRAWHDLHFAEPGETVDVIRTRNAAARRMGHALAEAPATASAKSAGGPASSQVAPQVTTLSKPPRPKGPPVRGVRRKGDTKFVAGARTQASIAKLNSLARQSA